MPYIITMRQLPPTTTMKEENMTVQLMILFIRYMLNRQNSSDTEDMVWIKILINLVGYFWFSGLWFIVLNAIFNNISVISWRSDLLMEKTTDLSQITDKLYHIMLYLVIFGDFQLYSKFCLHLYCHTCYIDTGPSIFFKCTSKSLFTSGTFY